MSAKDTISTRASVPQVSADDCDRPLDNLPVYQLPTGEAQAVQAHTNKLAQHLISQDASKVRAWLCHRIAQLDAAAQRHAALREALLASGISRATLRGARDADALSLSAHRRMVDLVELLHRLDHQHRPPSVSIKTADKVAIITNTPTRIGEGSGEPCDE